MKNIQKYFLVIGVIAVVVFICSYFIFRATPAYAQKQSLYEEYDKGAIPQEWGRLVNIGKSPTAFMVFEANDGTIRLFYNRKGNSKFDIGDDDMSIEVFKRE
jgi:hypothetical protein